METKTQYRYVWLDLNTGEFSNSWDEEEQRKYVDEDLIKMSAERGWKLIKYTCITDDNFIFYNKMKIVTNTKGNGNS